MGMIGRIIGLGRTAERIGGAVGGVAEVFVGNAAERDQADLERVKRALDQFSGEFAQPPSGPFDRCVDGFNRLPRPMLALGTLALFVYAMAEPVGFSLRMSGLNLIPEPLWWLLGAVVSFYFGARELHYYRSRLQAPAPRQNVANPMTGGASEPSGSTENAPFLDALVRNVSFGRSGSEPAVEVRASDPDFNAAIEEWRISRSRR